MATSLVVPCYQEEAALPALLPDLDALPVDEILFVDDGSTDATPERLAQARADDGRVRVVRHPRNRGVGAAMRTGFLAARGDVIVVYDADRTYPLEDVARLLAAVAAGADVATASPFTAGGTLEDVAAHRRLLSRAAAATYRLVVGGAGADVRTFTCAFRAWRAPWARRALPRQDGFAAAAEMLGRALLAGARVVEVASRLSARTAGHSKMRLAPALLGHARTLATLHALRTGLDPAGRVTDG